MVKETAQKPLTSILVVDDDPSVRLAVRHVLERDGHRVIEAADGRQALTIYEQQQPDVVLLDAMLPELDGFETCARLCRLPGGDRVPILFITALNDAESVSFAFEAGATDYIVKPIHWAVLRRRVRHLLQVSRAELTLRESEERYRMLVETSPDAIVRADLGLNILICNQQTALMLGYNRVEEILGKNALEFLTPEDHERALENFQKILVEGILRNIEYTLLKQNGARFLAELNVSMLIDAAGKPKGFVIVIRDITARKQADQKRQELEFIVNQSPAIAFLWRATPGWPVEFVSDNIAQFGYTPEYFISGQNSYASIIHPDDQERVAAEIVQYIQEGRTEYTQEYRILSQSGQVHWLDDRVWVRRDVNGEATHYQGIVVDITERKRTEEKIQRHNRELTLLNQVIAASVAGLEPEGLLDVACRELAVAFDMAQAIAALFNEAKTEIRVVAEYITQKVPGTLNSIAPVAASPVLQFLLTQQAPLAITDAQTDPRLARVRGLLRQRGTVSLLVLPLMVEGEVLGGLGLESAKLHHFSPEEVSLAWNVADQVAGVLARERLTQTRQRLSAAVEQTAESIIITDIAGVITYVNPAFERITGYSRSEAIGQNPRILKNDQQEGDFYQQLWATISAGQVWHGRFVNKKKEGTLYTADATITPVTGENSVIVNYVGIERDVTSELQLAEQLRQSQKMEAVGRLAGGIAHDFNNLLTVITGYSELLLARHLADDNPLRKSVEQIKMAGEQASALTQQLLAFSRKQPLQPQTLNLNTVVANIDKMLRRLIGEDIDLALILEPDLAQVTADSGHLEQIILNLAVNARDAMPQGGKLILETANVFLDETYAHQHAEVEPGPYVMLAVSDTGTGIDQETLSHIFEPFFTTKETGKGTGLGLATVHSIAKQNGGHIWVYTEPNRGTTFKVYLPPVKTTPELFAPDTAPTELPRGVETILVVEDEISVREIICNVLEASGYTVLQAANGQEAVRLCEEQLPEPIHLLLTDVIMPGMNGGELATQLEQRYPQITVLYTSGYTSNDADRAIIHPEGSDIDLIFLQKPFTPDALIRKVWEALHRVLTEPDMGDRSKGR